MKRKAALLTKICRCGTSVWEVQAEQFLPRYEEQVLCPQCGVDHSRNPPLLWRLRYGRHRLRRQARLLGLRAALALLKPRSPSAFLLPRERPIPQRSPQPEPERVLTPSPPIGKTALAEDVHGPI